MLAWIARADSRAITSMRRADWERAFGWMKPRVKDGWTEFAAWKLAGSGFGLATGARPVMFTPLIMVPGGKGGFRGGAFNGAPAPAPAPAALGLFAFALTLGLRLGFGRGRGRGAACGATGGGLIAAIGFPVYVVLLLSSYERLIR